MNFAEFYQQRYGNELDALFEAHRGPDYPICVQECRRAYNDCLAHPDGSNCSAELRDCIYQCAEDSDRAWLEKIQALEAKARAEYARSQNG